MALVGKVGAKSQTSFVVDLNPRIRLETWDNGAVSVHRGVLMYSFPLDANYTVTAHHFGDATMSNDYSLTSSTKWNYALDENSLQFIHNGPLGKGFTPFNHTNWPTVIHATAHEVLGWGMAQNSASAPPASPACTSASACGDETKITLVPHGGTDLRIGRCRSLDCKLKCILSMYALLFDSVFHTSI